MSAGIVKVTEAISADILSMLQQLMTAGGIKSSLSDDAVRAQIEKTDNPILRFVFAGYLASILTNPENANPCVPPMDELRDWALEKDLATDNKTLWNISVALWKMTNANQPLLSVLEEQIEESFRNEWAGMIIEVVIKEVDSFFSK